MDMRAFSSVAATKAFMLTLLCMILGQAHGFVPYTRPSRTITTTEQQTQASMNLALATPVARRDIQISATSTSTPNFSAEAPEPTNGAIFVMDDISDYGTTIVTQWDGTLGPDFPYVCGVVTYSDGSPGSNFYSLFPSSR
jgi:hypothetical protein